MTLKQRITLGLAAFLLALAVQIFLSFYQSGTVMQRLDDDIQDIDTLTRSIAVDSTIQEQLNALANADPETANYYWLLTGVRPLLPEKFTRTGRSAACNIPTSTATP